MQLRAEKDSTAEPLVPGRGMWTPAKLGRGLLLFLALTAVGFWILSRRGALGSISMNAVRSVHPAAVVAGFLMALLDQLLGGMRIWLCARALGQRLRAWPCVLANGANVFLGGVTPSQHAGGPAQIWILMRHGMRFSEATVTSFCTYLGTVVVFLVLTLMLAHGRSTLPVGGGLRVFTSGVGILFAMTILVSALALPHPGGVIRAQRAVLRRVPRLGRRLVVSAGARSLERLWSDYSLLVWRGLRHGKLLLLAAVVFSGLIYLNKFLVAYVIVRGLGLHPRPADVLYLQALQSLVTYFVPTPGASGVAEVTAAELMQGIVPASSLGLYIVMWRAMGLYLSMALGAVMVSLSGLAKLRRSAPMPPPCVEP